MVLIDDAWVTSVANDAEVSDAFQLASSLRRTFTRKKIVAIYSENVSTKSLQLLETEFDHVQLLRPAGCHKDLCFEESVKIYLHQIRFFQRGIFLSSSIMVLRSADFLFESFFHSPTPHLAWSGGQTETTYKVDLKAPFCAIKPSLAFADYLRQSISSDNKRTSKNYEFEALESKGKRLFSYYGVDISCDRQQFDSEDDDKVAATFVKLPPGYSQRKTLLESCQDYWGTLIQLVKDNLGSSNSRVEATTVTSLDRMKEEPIAIIGMACRLPASNDLEEFWQLLVNKEDAIQKVPEWRWTEEHVEKVTAEARKSQAGFLKCPVDEFDAKFFGMSPKEMDYTDPQQRMLLEISWEALENAAVDPMILQGTQTGIFTGTWTRDYSNFMNRVRSDEEREFFRSYMGNSYGATAGRMAHFYGTTGSNVATESGCSSSMVAVGLACSSLRRHKINMALACGVNLILQPTEYEMMAAFCAEDGHCKTFDEAADGFGRAEGCGVIVMKRLSDAIRDRDNIRAVIRGYGEAQEGPSKSLGTPTVEVEKLAMILALKDAEVLPWEVSFVEAHGTGTAVGDPMEMEAISQVYSEGRKEPLVVTSVKTNVGHTESVSGMTGIIKTVLGLERQLLPPHRSLNKLNPKIDLSKTPAVIPLEVTPWPKDLKKKRIAGVSSFGITGTDTHVILEEAPPLLPAVPQRQTKKSPSCDVLAISARSEVALEELIQKYSDKLSNLKSVNCDQLSWKEVTFTANTGRAHFKEFRAAIVAKTIPDFLHQVERQSMKVVKCPAAADKPRVTFLFTGQGSQYSGMAKELYEVSEEFSRLFNKCDRILRQVYDIDIKRALWNSDKDSSELLHQTLYSQTSIFVIDFCLAELWKSWGVNPDVVVGHSLGEYAAAVVAGILSLEDGLKLVAGRSQLINKLPQGKMIVININYEATQRLLKKIGNTSVLPLDVAAMNSPEQTTLAGTEEAILTFKKFCDNNGVKSHILEATHAFHSRMMDPALPELRKLAQSVKLNSPTCTYISGMEGIEKSSIDAEYWVRHTREPVNFAKACETLREGENGIIAVEAGPQPILSSFVARNFEDTPMSSGLLLLPSLRRSRSDCETLCESVGKMYTAGVDVNWKGYYRHTETSKTAVAALPSYPFQRKKFWYPRAKNSGLHFSGNQLHPLLHFRFPSATPTRIFDSILSLKKQTYIKDHVVGTHVIFPAAGYLEIILAAGHCATLAEFEDFRFPRQPIFLRDLIVEAPLEMTQEDDVQLQTIVAPADDDNWNSVTIHRRAEDAAGTKSWLRHSSAKFLSYSNDSPALEIPDHIDIAHLTQSLNVEDMGSFYEKLQTVGLNFGETFRSVKKVWNGSEETLTEVVCPAGSADELHFVHPVAIDAMIQTLMASQHDNMTQLMVPVKIEQFAWFGSSPSSAEPSSSTPNSLFVYVKKNSPDNADEPSAVLLDMNGKKVAVMGGVTLVPTTVLAIENSLQSQKMVLPEMLEEEWVPASTSFRLTNEDSTVPERFFESPAGLKLLQIEKDQQRMTERELAEVPMAHEGCALQGLEVLLEIGWTQKVNEVIDVREFPEKYGVSQTFLLMVRRIFEMASQHTDYIVKVDGSGEFSFAVKKEPTRAEIRRRHEELARSVLTHRTELECVTSVETKTAAGVLKGSGSILSILFGEERIAERVYTEFQGTIQSNALLVQTIQTLSNSEFRCEGRGLRILEVGGGTGGSTRSILPALEESGVEFFYTFTDISAGFFTAASTSFAEWKDKMQFKVLDIEKDPKTQGFLAEDFDIIIATHVLHATRNLTETIANVRHLLRPNGLALIVEVYEPSPLVDLIFGFVEGYWRFEDLALRPFHCILPKASWPNLLRSSGFSDQRLLKVTGSNCGVIVAQASPCSIDYTLPSSQLTKTWVIAQGCPNDNGIATNLASKLERQGRKITVWADGTENNKWKSEVESGIVEGIVFISAGKTFDTEGPPKVFLKIIQQLMSFRMPAITPKIVVVTEGAVTLPDQTVSSPDAGILWGMSRTLRSENSTYSVLNIDLDPHVTNDVNVSSLLRLLWTASNKAEFIAIRDKKVLIAKLKRWKVKNSYLPLPESAERYGLILPKSNAINDLQFGVRQRLPVGENQVEMELKAAALNFRDLFGVLKPSKDFEKNAAVGTDMAGVVTAVGENVTRLKVGDRVVGCFFDFGGLPSHVVVSGDRLVKLPSNLTFADGSTLPAVYTTAYYCLIDVAKLQRGETLLIHTASGGVGIAAIQVARQVGAKIIATAGSQRKKTYLREVMGIEHVFHSRDFTYREDILNVTGGKGVDVVLNSLTGVGFKEATLDVCKQGGRFIEMSKLNIWSEDDVKERRADVDYQIIDLTILREETLKDLLSKLDESMESGMLAPLPYESFESVDIREALMHLQKARHIGKVVCKMPEITPGSEGKSHLLFNERSTYLITGGLGGIGLEAAKWMACEGAKFIVLCGRRLPNEKALQVISELNSNGKFVTSVQVDVGKFEDCKTLIEKINNGELSVNGETYPPLRGIQHAAGCLSDATFPNQTWEKYEETFNGKVKGAWNLHQLTRNARLPLEHFVMYSSLAATFGSIGQSNHTAGNAFLDSLAHFRNARGLPATSVNWGQWGQVGVAADLELSFLKPFTPLQGFASLKEILRHHKLQVGVIESDFSKLKVIFPWIDHGYANAIMASTSSSDKRTAFALNSDKFWSDIEAANGDVKETELVLQRTLIDVIRQILKLEEGEPVDIDGNLQEMGLDSLMMLELKNILQGVLGPKFALNSNVFADANTIKKLAAKLRQTILEYEEEISPEEKVKFILGQCDLPEDLAALMETEKSDVGNLEGENVSVLLNGAVDSLFGSYVVENLMRRPNVKKVVILSSTFTNETFVSKLKEDGLKDIDDQTKIQIITQDESTPTELGIAHSDYEILASEIDAIVDIRLKSTGSQDEPRFVIKREAETTRRLLEFATTNKLKFLCHINKLLPQRKGANQSQIVMDETLPCGNEEDLDRVVGGGYNASQFVSECLLKDAIGRGVPCFVFRVPHLSGDSRTGRFQLEEDHIFVRYLQFISVGKIPSVPIPFAIVPVNQAASLLLEALWSTSSALPDGTLGKTPQIFNLSNPHEYSISDFIAVSNELGKPVRAVEIEEFLEENKNSAIETATFMFGDPLDFSSENSNYSKLLESSLDDLVSCSNLRTVVDSFEIHVETPVKILRRDLQFALNSGMLQKFLPSEGAKMEKDN